MAAVDRELGLYMLCVASVAAGYSDDPASVTAIAELAARLPAADTPVEQFLARFLAAPARSSPRTSRPRRRACGPRSSSPTRRMRRASPGSSGSC